MGDLEERVIDWTVVIERWLVQNDVDDDEQVVMDDRYRYIMVGG